jgi:TRAP-type C4-dicarboxylate transport system substrate-binding protein
MNKRNYLFVALMAAFFAGAPAQAQERKIVLRVADSFPASGHYFVEPGLKPFMEAVRKATHGQVEFQHFPAEQMGKARDLLALTQTGAVDIGSVMPSYAPDKLPLSAVAELPGMFTTSCEGTLAYWNLARSGVLAQKEFKPAGIRVLMVLVNSPYQALMRQKIAEVKDFDGKKMRVLGSAVDMAMRKLKAIPIRMSAPEIYESMSRGTLDGTVISYGAAVSYNLGGLAKSVTQGESFGSSVLTYSISEAKWQSLPANVQKAMLEAGDEATRRSCQTLDQNTNGDLGKLEKLGVTPVSFTQAESQQLRTMFAEVATVWGGELDHRGRPGTEVLKAYKAAMQASPK